MHVHHGDVRLPKRWQITECEHYGLSAQHQSRFCNQTAMAERCGRWIV